MQFIQSGTGGQTDTLASTPTNKLTRRLLTCGIIAEPLYIIVGALEMLTRAGFDLRRHPLSLMSNGDWGWVHSTMLVTTGVLTIVGAVGMRRALHNDLGKIAAPVTVGLYGLGLIGAGVFSTDPALGFPPGTPMDANTVSWHGMLHFIVGAIGFLGLIIACFVFARYFAAHKQWGWTVYSVTTGILFSAAFYGIATGSQHGGALLTFVLLAFTAAVVLGWLWLSAIGAHLRQRVR
jgi:hypothetical protein